jgi:YfiH family protein
MFLCSPDGVFRSAQLAEFEWLVHGFGSRRSDGWPGSYTRLKQIHSDTVISISEGADCAGEGDALVTAMAGRLLGIRTADCVPLLFADTRNRAVGAVHAGWRGTAASIASRAVEAMRREFSTRPDDLIVAIGPCISECCFEVGPEVGELFRSMFPDRQQFGRVDLVEANRRQLIAAGVHSERIDVSNLCTACNASDFHSYRRDREKAGRMVAAIGVTGRSI